MIYTYTIEQKRKVLNFISKHYGSPVKIINLNDYNRTIPIDYDLLLIETKNSYLLMTIGLGAFDSHNHDEESHERSEIYLELPLDWDLNNPQNYWAINFLINIVKYSYEQHLTLKWLQVFINPNYFSHSNKVAGYLDLPWNKIDANDFVLTNDFVVSFYQVVILSDDELFFGKVNSFKELAEYFEKEENRIVNLSRKSLVKI
ncbi:suppressor of fused domain protein [Ureaplasma miroungigenitalium]|uniref:Suppressor of fused domain protein n=1 Tax=Ureaplasma miroungigenitalium TaxID=1042321 RepID=A0ABT3BMZ4_9BACT|nr:suppressor of fused domain protein [Ureaplasma miroungigenitalium]MCV3728512.1 suppressor of fused domain protein [Ureaplasma miroungigenitalium]MCV3734299.1 suppressor of fused domain protein [Ureaplasma miroungigenitalium]